MPGRREGPDHADNRVQRTRDASEFVARVPYLPARAADPMRQMGDFAGAGPMRCDALSLVGQPGFGDGWRTYLNPSAIVIACRDAPVEPLDMMPVLEAAP